MTCIVGMLDQENDSVWIGGDSLGSDGYTKSLQNQSKVFKHEIFKNIILGGTGSFRHLDILKYYERLFEEVDFYKQTPIDHKYMVTKFIPRLIETFNYEIVHEKETDRGANFIVGAENKLFEIQSDYSVLEPATGYVSVGCGRDAAHASLFTSQNFDLTVPQRIELALGAAEFCCCGVQRPFRIINTKDDQEIIIE